IVLVCSPIGAGAMNNLWSAVAPDWRASADRVALVSGVLNGVISAIGCIIGGWVADRVGRWWAYFGSGLALAIVAIVMAVAPRSPESFIAGVLAYSFVNGIAYAAFSAVVPLAIGRGAASTKYAALSSLGNLPVVYMTALDGWAHDKFGTSWMLHCRCSFWRCLYSDRDVRAAENQNRREHQGNSAALRLIRRDRRLKILHHGT